MKKKISFLFILVVCLMSGLFNVNAEEVLITNPNIVAIYQYNRDSSASNYCVTGEETTCAKLASLDKVPAGTIVKYKVNGTEEVVFHVMYDNGNTLTMQSQKNTINMAMWISPEDYAKENTDGTNCGYVVCNDEGPITTLTALENATKGWTNVNTQNYAMGVTMFITDGFTGCRNYDSCDAQPYVLNSRTAKARMITVQEAKNLGCANISQTCPIWMYNYLHNSTYYGGTASDDEKDAFTESYNDAYWTMNAHSSEIGSAWAIFGAGNLTTSSLSNVNHGVRAVVSINKQTVKNTIDVDDEEKKDTTGNNQVVDVEDTSWNISKVWMYVGLVIFVIGAVIIVQTYTRNKKVKDSK